MNTPTHAQALAEVLRLSEIATDGPWEVDAYADVIANGEDVARIATGDDYADCDAGFIVAAVNFIRQHGKHFAGLVEERGELSRNLGMAMNVVENLTARAEVAEARCAELEAKHEEVVGKYSGAADRCHLLFDAKEHWRDRAGEAGILLDRVLTQVGKTITSELHEEVAAFLAAKGA